MFQTKTSLEKEGIFSVSLLIVICLEIKIWIEEHVHVQFISMTHTNSEWLLIKLETLFSFTVMFKDLLHFLSWNKFL